MSAEFFSRIKNIGSLLGRDFGKIHAKASQLRESGGSQATLAFLKENLAETPAKVDAKQVDSYALCRVLFAECQAECGVSGNSPRQVLEGIQALLRLPGSYPSLVQSGNSTWPDLLGKVEKLLRAVLDPQWVPNSNKSAFLTEIAAVAASWNQLQKPQFAQRACQMGLRVFGGDATLLLLQAEAEASLGNFPQCLECLKAVIRSGAGIQSPGKMITLLEMAQGDSDPSNSGPAWALAAEVYYRLNRWEQAFTSAEKASKILGDSLEDFSVQALLISCSRCRKLDEFEQYSQRFLKRGLSADLLALLTDETRQLLNSYPHRKRLWLTCGASALRAGQVQDAVMAFKQSLVIDRALAPEVVEWYRVAGAYSTAETSLCVNLAQVLFRAGQADEALSVLSRLDSDSTSASQLDEAVALCREIVERSATNPAPRSCLVRLLLRQGDLEGALAGARKMLSLAGAAQAVVELCFLVAQKAQGEADGALLIPALQLETEAQLKVPDPKAALERLQALSQHAACTRDRLLWAAECLRGIATEAGFETSARIILADVLFRLQFHGEACEQLLAVLDQELPADLLEKACASLAQVWSHAADPQRARAGLVSAWLRLGRPGEAREPLLACIEAKQSECARLLELLDARLSDDPAQVAWANLSLEADLALGDEARLGSTTHRLQQCLEQNADSAAWVEESARRLEQKAGSPEIKKAAILLQAQALAAGGQIAQFAALMQSVTAQHREWRADFVRGIEKATAKAEPAEKARLGMTLGQMLADSGQVEAERAVACYAEAAQLDPEEWGEEALARTTELASRTEGYAGAILTALQIAIRLGKGGMVCSDVLRLLDRLADDEVCDARGLMEAVLKEKPFAPQAWLVKARCSARLKDLSGALEAYQRILPLAIESLVAAAVADLRTLQTSHAENAEVFSAYVDALLRHADVATARDALLERVSRFPQQAEPCLKRLEALQQTPEHSWEDRGALAEALRVAGKPAQAVPIWNQILSVEGIDWHRCATALQQLCIALPKDFAAGALLVRAETRSLPPDKLQAVVQRMERVLALPEKSESYLQGLLGDCAVIEQRAKGREELARLSGLRRTEILARQKNHAAAAAELDRIVQRWPKEARAAAAFCRREVTSGAPIYLVPLARARFAAGDMQAGAEALRKLVEALPEQSEAARELCQEFAAKSKGPGWASLQLLLADLAAQGPAFTTAAQLYLTLATQAPESVPTVKQRLSSLIQGGVEAPEVSLTLADLELDAKAENISAAFEVLKQLLDRDTVRNLGLVLDYLRGLARRFPKVLEARRHVLWALFRRTELAFDEIREELEALLQDFGKEGASAFIGCCTVELAAKKEHAPLWHLKCAAHERLEDVSGSLDCLKTLMSLDLEGQAESIKQRAVSYHKPGSGPAAVTAFLADFARATGKCDEAAQYYAEATELPDTDLSHAREGLKAILDSEPGNGTALCALARCEWRAGSPVAAARCYQLAAGLPGAPVLDERLRELCEVFPESGKCWFVRAQYCQGKDQFAEAFSCLQHTCPGPDLEREEQVSAWKMLADCYARQGQFEESVSIMRRVVEADPADDTATRRLISLYFEKNAYQLAQTKAAMGKAGETPELILECAELLRAQGDYAEAVRWFKKVPRDNPLASLALLELGRCHLVLHQCHLAVAAFKAVLADSPTPEQSREALYHLGLAYSRLLEFADAVDVFERLCMEDADYRDAAEQLQRCHDQWHESDVFRLAEVPFDLLTAWREYASVAKSPSAVPSAPQPIPHQIT